MQKITVKEVRGPLGKGEKKFYAVVDEKGAEFTTFDTKIAQVTPGSVLEIEPKVDGKYVNIAEWKVIEEGPALPGGNGSRYGKSPEQIALERGSIEGQTAYNGMVQLLEKTTIVPDDIRELVFRYAKTKMEDSLAKPTAAKKPAESAEKADSGGFQNAGQFLGKAQEVFSLNKSEVLANPEVKALYEAKGYGKAYMKLAELMAKK